MASYTSKSPASSSSEVNEESSPSSSMTNPTPIVLAKERSILKLVQFLLDSEFYKFESPEKVSERNRFFFSVDGIDKTFINPGLCSTKIYTEHKENVLDTVLPDGVKIPVSIEKPLKELPIESMIPISLDAIFAYYFHRNISAYALSQESDIALMNKKNIPSLDILDFFGVPKKSPEEKCDLTLRRLHSILEEKFFQFRRPEQPDTNFVFIRTRSGFFIKILQYHQKQELDASFLTSPENVVFYQDQMYSCLTLEYLVETFIIPFCMDLGAAWEITDDDFI